MYLLHDVPCVHPIPVPVGIPWRGRMWGGFSFLTKLLVSVPLIIPRGAVDESRQRQSEEKLAMSIDEQDREAGRLQREKISMNRELVCWIAKRRRYTGSLKQLCTWLENDEALMRGTQQPNHVGVSGKDSFEWLDMNDVIQINVEIRRLRSEIALIEKSLADMGYA